MNGLPTRLANNDASIRRSSRVREYEEKPGVHVTFERAASATKRTI